jgi:hypothetical protein
MRQVGLILEDGFQVMALAALAAFELANATRGDDGYRLTVLSERFMLKGARVTVHEFAPPWVDTDLIKKSGDPGVKRVALTPRSRLHRCRIYAKAWPISPNSFSRRWSRGSSTGRAWLESLAMTRRAAGSM